MSLFRLLNKNPPVTQVKTQLGRLLQSMGSQRFGHDRVTELTEDLEN